MMGKAEATTSSNMDVFKLVISVGTLVAGIITFYIFADQPLLYRVLGVIATVVIAAIIALTTARGRSFAGFMKDARTEVRKMVWPTRIETLQTTIVVFIAVILLAAFLWLIDRILTTLIQFVIQ